MNCMINEVIQEASTDIVNTKYIITLPEVLTEIDLNICTINACDFNSPFNLTAVEDGELVSLVGYFDTFFDLPNAISFSTGPLATPTHWKQTVFFLKDPIIVKKGIIFYFNLFYFKFCDVFGKRTVLLKKILIYTNFSYYIFMARCSH